MSDKLAAKIVDSWYKSHNKMNFAIQKVIDEEQMSYENAFVTLKVMTNHIERYIRLHYGARADSLLGVLVDDAEDIERMTEEYGKTSAKSGKQFDQIMDS